MKADCAMSEDSVAVPADARRCKGCSVWVSMIDFPLTKSKGGYGPYRSHYCRQCKRDKHKAWRDANPAKTSQTGRKSRLARYGLTAEQYAAMYSAQGGLCAICSQGPGMGVTRENLAVDHDHATGKVRGLLCDFCNRGLGIFADNPQRLAAAISYLQNGGVTHAIFTQ